MQPSTAYLSAVGHKAVNQRVAVVEQSVELLGGLHGKWGVPVELLPLHWHGVATRRRHALHLTRHLWPGQTAKRGQHENHHFSARDGALVSQFVMNWKDAILELQLYHRSHLVMTVVTCEHIHVNSTFVTGMHKSQSWRWTEKPLHDGGGNFFLRMMSLEHLMAHIAQ